MNVGDPYRTSGGTPCPRCKNVLDRESDDELVCANGCGVWLANKLLLALMPLETITKSSGNPFRAEPLPPTKCLVCKTALNDLYKGTVDVLTIGQCLEHGIWLEHGDRATFEAMFRGDIRRAEVVRAKQEELADVDPEIVKLLVRIEALETEVRMLRDLVEDLRKRIRD